MDVPGIGKKTAEKILDIVSKSEPKPEEEIEESVG
jgi:Holliday junction resolvasome RuvABC DNA-binding subunit